MAKKIEPKTNECKEIKEFSESTKIIIPVSIKMEEGVGMVYRRKLIQKIKIAKIEGKL